MHATLQRKTIYMLGITYIWLFSVANLMMAMNDESVFIIVLLLLFSTVV